MREQRKKVKIGMVSGFQQINMIGSDFSFLRILNFLLINEI
jgi:hypothetical protein